MDVNFRAMESAAVHLMTPFIHIKFACTSSHLWLAHQEYMRTHTQSSDENKGKGGNTDEIEEYHEETQKTPMTLNHNMKNSVRPNLI